MRPICMSTQRPFGKNCVGRGTTYRHAGKLVSLPAVELGLALVHKLALLKGLNGDHLHTHLLLIEIEQTNTTKEGRDPLW